MLNCRERRGGGGGGEKGLFLSFVFIFLVNMFECFLCFIFSVKIWEFIGEKY